MPLCTNRLNSDISNQLEQVGAIESVKAASDIYSPVSGEIVNVNEALSDEPSLINSSPEEDGKNIVISNNVWICTKQFDRLVGQDQDQQRIWTRRFDGRKCLPSPLWCCWRPLDIVKKNNSQVVSFCCNLINIYSLINVYCASSWLFRFLDYYQR